MRLIGLARKLTVCSTSLPKKSLDARLRLRVYWIVTLIAVRDCRGAVKGRGALNGFSSRTSLNFTLIKSCTCVHPLLKYGHLN